MLIHKLPQTPYTAFPLDWQVRAQENIVYSAFSLFALLWAIDLVGKPNTASLIWNHFHSCHPSVFVQVFSSSRDRRRSDGQVCISEAFSKLAKYKRGKWKILTRNVATYAVIPILQRARAADEELMRPLAWWRNRELCLNRTQQVESVYRTFKLSQYVINRTRQFTARDCLSYRAASSVDRVSDYRVLARVR